MFKNDEDAINFMITLLRKLVRSKPENPPGNEKDTALIVKLALEEIGLDTTLDFVTESRPNVIAHINGGSKGLKILLNGHLDVVPATQGWSVNPFDITIKNGRIYGRGTVDMFGGLVAMIAATKQFLDVHKSFNGSIIFTAVVDEEAGGSGTKHLVKKGVDADFGFVSEPSNNKLFICERGIMWYKFKVYGKAAHGSLPHEGVNAIEVLINLLNTIKQIKLEYSPHKYLGFHTINFGTISGGRKVNIVADYAEAEVDIRTTPIIKHEEIKNKINNVVQALSKLYDAEIKHSLIIEALPFEIDENSDFVKRTVRAITKAIGFPPKLDGMPGATDARFFVEQGIPTLIYGPGPIEKAHKDDEFVTMDSLIKTYRAYYSILEHFLT
ncbi:MAG: M20 family metallopeptidase [Candidatus Asgardarchaeia archaeon]